MGKQKLMGMHAVARHAHGEASAFVERGLLMAEKHKDSKLFDEPDGGALKGLALEYEREKSLLLQEIQRAQLAGAEEIRKACQEADEAEAELRALREDLVELDEAEADLRAFESRN